MENLLENIKEFFSDYCHLIDTEKKQFENSFLKFKNNYNKIISEYRKLNFELAESFNIFQILNIMHYEVSTHSAILRELLDSNGTHGQGNLFFIEFLNMLVGKGILLRDDPLRYSAKQFDNYSCIAEKSIDNGRIDIIISRFQGDFPFCLIIENKVYAKDQEKQIERYWDKLKRMNIPEDRKKILYLTPDGRDPSEWSIDKGMREELEDKGILHYISYKVDIKKWLEDVLKKTRSPKVQCLLQQYVDILGIL